MPVPSTTPQDSHAIMVVVLLTAGLCVVYWRIAIRLVAIILVALAAYGLVNGMQH
jgi:hypothetical protein